MDSKFLPLYVVCIAIGGVWGLVDVFGQMNTTPEQRDFKACVDYYKSYYNEESSTSLCRSRRKF